MVSEGDSLLLAVAANLDDDTPRLIYANWLEKSGNVDRANFIRRQINIARGQYFDDLGNLLPQTPEVAANYEARTNELLKANWPYWEDEIRQALGTSCVEVTFHRGFPARIMVSARLMVSGVEKLIASRILLSDTNTLTDLEVRDLPDHLLPQLLSCPGIDRLTTLDFWSNNIGPLEVTAISNSPHLAKLTTLELGNNRIGDAGATAISNSPHLAKLTTLGLGNNYIGIIGAQAIAASPYLSPSAKATGLRSAGFDTLGEQVEREARQRLAGGRDE